MLAAMDFVRSIFSQGVSGFRGDPLTARSVVLVTMTMVTIGRNRLPALPTCSSSPSSCSSSSCGEVSSDEALD